VAAQRSIRAFDLVTKLVTVARGCGALWQADAGKVPIAASTWMKLVFAAKPPVDEVVRSMV
jgi:hypothetical protein